MADTLNNSLDLERFSHFARNRLIDILNSNAQKQDLIIDQSLMKPLDRIAGATLLKENGVDKIFKLERTKPPLCGDSQIYLVRPTLTQTKYIADHINADKNSGLLRKYKVVYVPKKFHMCEMIIEQEGVHGDVAIEELTVDFVPLDSDVISMEIPDFFRAYFLDGDQHWLGTITHAIVTLQKQYGTIPNIFGIGNFAKLVKNMLGALTKKGEDTPTEGPGIDTLVLIDRDVDYVTPLCSQVTYEGLIDDTFEINSGMVTFDKTVTGTEKTLTMLLNSNDMVYKEIRDRHFTNVFPFLSLKAKQLQVGYDKRNHLSSVGDMKQFVSKDLRQLQQQHKSLQTHIGACESILKQKNLEKFENQLSTERDILEGVNDKDTVAFIEELIMKQLPLYRSLQLMCLMSVTRSGLDSKVYKSLRQQLLQTYGYQHLVNLFNLKKLRIFTEYDKRNNFKNLCKKLNLIPKVVEPVDLNIPTDMSYVFGGSYAPLSCKLVEQVCSRGGFQGLEEITRMIGETFHTTQRTSNQESTVVHNKQRVILVFFIGGCTSTEITSLRFLAKQRGWKIIVATTSVMNSKRMLESLMDVM
ncbi:vacuolar protein sorting-associated protein 33B-like [Xenia sp. Carnegie-2017]|uniref:vacuolar protein sorting-associated protein 33B-like n=1 Tax=Xenia sp. Carnegie-2017 TaxID=2897299 RepID=UPI001F04F8A5|nr:vacuolar protein sorting-associated protein 33B-like [Xenia sp. Carnegie-2017]